MLAVSPAVAYDVQIDYIHKFTWAHFTHFATTSLMPLRDKVWPKRHARTPKETKFEINIQNCVTELRVYQSSLG
jgi:hypothetical protein